MGGETDLKGTQKKNPTDREEPGGLQPKESAESTQD